MAVFWKRRPVFYADLIEDRLTLDALIASVGPEVLEPIPEDINSQRISDLVTSEPAEGGWRVDYEFYDGGWTNPGSVTGEWGQYLVIIPPNNGVYMNPLVAMSPTDFAAQYEPVLLL